MGSLRIVLLVVSALTALFVLRKIRKAQFSIDDAVYWVFFCGLLLILSVFPGISFFFSDLIGFESPSNFIFVVFIFLLLIKMFLMSVKIAGMQAKLNNLVQKYALDMQKDRVKEEQKENGEILH